MADPTAARTPLMAGNWKMNLNHVEAVHLVQKLSWTLQDKKHDFERVEVAVIPRSPTSAACRRWSTVTG
jgi:triosephosphate isomerase